MWTWTLNWSEISTDIVVGSCPMTIRDIDRIAQGAQPTALLSLQHDECLEHFSIDYAAHLVRAEQLGLVSVRCPMRDFDVEDMRHRLPGAVAALSELLAGGLRVYLYCTAGLGRSVLVAFAYLTLVQGYTREKANEILRACRPGAAPNLDAYQACRRDLVEKYRAPIEQRAWDISHRHTGGNPTLDWCQAEAEIIRETLAGRTANSTGAAVRSPGGPGAGSSKRFEGSLDDLESGLANLETVYEHLGRIEQSLAQGCKAFGGEVLTDLEHTAEVLRDMARSVETIPVASPPGVVLTDASAPAGHRHTRRR